MPRHVEAEWLDTLAEDDARAVRSRRELVLVNALMANAGIVARELAARLPRRELKLAELGSGDGRFSLRVLRRLDRRGHVTLVDRQSAPGRGTAAGFAEQGWGMEAVRADATEWLRDCPTRFDAVFANLFLHHFEPPALAAMLNLLPARTALFIACEPRRSRLAMAGSRMLGLIGCGEVTRHDALASVRAGFRGEEISASWGESRGWRLAESSRGLFSHLFVAESA